MKEIDYFVKILSQWRKKEGKRIQILISPRGKLHALKNIFNTLLKKLYNRTDIGFIFYPQF